MIVEIEKLVDALQAYRATLLGRGELLKAAAVSHCIVIVRRLAS